MSREEGSAPHPPCSSLYFVCTELFVKFFLALAVLFGEMRSLGFYKPMDCLFAAWVLLHLEELRLIDCGGQYPK